MKNNWLVALLILKNFALIVNAWVFHCMLMVFFSLYQGISSGHTIYVLPQMKDNWLIALLIFNNSSLTVNA